MALGYIYRPLRFMMQSFLLCRPGTQSRFRLHYSPMVSISLWDNLTCDPWVCSLSSLRQNRALNQRRLQVTGIFYPLTGRKQPRRASGAEWGEGKNAAAVAAAGRHGGSLRDKRGVGGNPAQGGQSEAGNFAKSNFLREIMAKWKNNGSGIIGLLARRY